MNKPVTKPILSLTVSDLRQFPIWESIVDNEPDVSVFPVTGWPVSRLSGRAVGTTVKLSCGEDVWAVILFLNPNDPRQNEHFISLRIERDGQWFDLARYWDVDYARNGPEALARFLGKPVDEVFPISYDVSKYVNGDRNALVGQVLKEPLQRLSEDEIIKMAVP